MPAVSRKILENIENSQSQNTFVPGTTEEYITQVSQEIGGRVIKQLSLEFSRTESRFLGALPKLDDFVSNPLARTLSGTVPQTSRNTDLENREPTGARSQSDPHPEVELFTRRINNSTDSDPEGTSHMVTGVQEGIFFCSIRTSSGKQKRARSKNQPEICCANTLATIEADQILLALQQFASNTNSANFNNNIDRISKLPKSLTTAMPTFNGKSKKIELIEDLFQMSSNFTINSQKKTI